MSGSENIVLKLIRQLSSPSYETRENAAIDIFQDLNNKTLPITPKLFSALTEALDDDYKNVVHYAALSIAYIAGKGRDMTFTIPKLGKTLNDVLDSGDTGIADDLLGALLNASKKGNDLSPAVDAMAKALFYSYDSEGMTLRYVSSQSIMHYINHFIGRKVETGDYDSALVEIKKVTTAVMDASKAKKIKHIKERREVLGTLSILTNSIHTRMNTVDKDKKFPVRRQEIKKPAAKRTVKLCH